MHNAATEVKLGTYQKYLPSSQKNPANIVLKDIPSKLYYVLKEK